jgi:hypothetical protein
MNELDALDDEKLTPEEIAREYKQHVSTVRKRFFDEPGVIRIGHPTLRNKRQYFTLRIPRSVVNRVYGRMTVR